jgi:hypothetical protein
MGKLVIDRPGMNALYRERVEAADARIRQHHTGEPAQTVRWIAQQEFAHAGLVLPPGDLFGYAQSVWLDTDFVLKA